MNNDASLKEFLFGGTVQAYDYEYYAKIDDEFIKVDNCFSNLLGSSYCVLNDFKYNNVTYSVNKINYREEHIDGFFNTTFGMIFLMLTLLGIMINILSKIFKI